MVSPGVGVTEEALGRLEASRLLDQIESEFEELESSATENEIATLHACRGVLSFER